MTITASWSTAPSGRRRRSSCSISSAERCLADPDRHHCSHRCRTQGRLLADLHARRRWQSLCRTSSTIPRSGPTGARTPFAGQHDSHQVCSIQSALKLSPLSIRCRIYPGDPLLGPTTSDQRAEHVVRAISSTPRLISSSPQNQRASVRYSRLRSNQDTPTVFGDGDWNDGVHDYNTTVHNAGIDYDWTISPTLLLHLRVGLDRVEAPGESPISDSAVGWFSVASLTRTA